jgi:hypothetical protein
VQHAQWIEWAEAGGEVESTAPREQLGSRSEIATSEGRIELTEQVRQPLYILRGAVMDDCEILGCDRSTVKHGGSSPDHDELDSGSHKSLDQGIEISLSGMRHS